MKKYMVLINHGDVQRAEFYDDRTNAEKRVELTAMFTFGGEAEMYEYDQDESKYIFQYSSEIYKQRRRKA